MPFLRPVEACVDMLPAEAGLVGGLLIMVRGHALESVWGLEKSDGEVGVFIEIFLASLFSTSGIRLL